MNKMVEKRVAFYLVGTSIHLKLCLADAIQHFKWVENIHI